MQGGVRRPLLFEISQLEGIKTTGKCLCAEWLAPSQFIITESHIQIWFSLNFLKRISNKPEIIMIGTKPILSKSHNLCLSINSLMVKRQGVIFDSTLSLQHRVQF